MRSKEKRLLAVEQEVTNRQIDIYGEDAGFVVDYDLDVKEEL